ncbi:MAG: hypothetical protein ABR520_01315 [Mycobacteriales bacterium]
MTEGVLHYDDDRRRRREQLLAQRADATGWRDRLLARRRKHVRAREDWLRRLLER